MYKTISATLINYQTIVIFSDLMLSVHMSAGRRCQNRYCYLSSFHPQQLDETSTTN